MSKILKLVITRGLPGSGKSFWAAEEKARLEANHVECRIVNKDDIRKELTATGWQWSKENEKDVIRARDMRIVDALRRNVCVISSDTNFGKHEAHLKQLAKEHGAAFEVKDFTNVDIMECVRRDALRPDGERVGADVIKSMYAKYLAHPDFVPYVADQTKSPAIICDLDGTLALHVKRSPFDYAKLSTDQVNKPVANIIKRYAAAGFSILYISGREDWCKPETAEWLDHNKLNLPGRLLMRASKDYRKDFIVKYEIFDREIRNEFNVLFVLDDRTQVVKMWRQIGLSCWQVNDGDF